MRATRSAIDEETWRKMENHQIVKQLLPDTVHDIMMRVMHGAKTKITSRSKQFHLARFIDFVLLVICDDVDIRPVNWSSSSSSASSSDWCLGTFARRALPANHRMTSMNGTLVPIHRTLYDTLIHQSFSNSVVALPKSGERVLLTVAQQQGVEARERINMSRGAMGGRGLSRTQINDTTMEACAPSRATKRKFDAIQSSSSVSTNTGLQHYILLGPLSFVNHKCWHHQNCQPFVETADPRMPDRKSDDEYPLRASEMWTSLMTLNRMDGVKSGDELFIDYDPNRAETLDILAKKAKKGEKRANERLTEMMQEEIELTCMSCTMSNK